VKVRDKEGNVRRTIRKTNFDVYFVVTPNQVLVLRTD
jgi:hypothetical protein